MSRNKVPAPREHDEHAALVEWARNLEPQFPRLALLFHPPMEGKRAPWKARQLAIKSGVPDLLLPCPSADGRHIGLAVEMKAGRNKTTEAQEWWLAQLDAAGWRAVVHTSKRPGDWSQAALIIAEHLGLPETVTRWL